MEELFDSFIRTRTTRSDHRESTYKFLNESAWPSAEYFRNVICEWYKFFPKDYSFFQQFTSLNDNQHYSAFFELYMFTMCRKLGYEVDYHQPIGTRKIDLTLKKGNLVIQSDCVLSGEPNVNHSILSMEKEITDIIEQIESPLFWISIDFVTTSSKMPRVSRIRKMVENEVAKLEKGDSDTNRISYSEDEWEISFRFRHKSPAVQRTLGSVSTSQGGGFIDGKSMEVLRKTLNAKRGSTYGVETPYVIAVNSMNWSLNFELIKGVLFGNMPIDGYQSNLFVKNPFFYMNEPQNTTVSGIIITHGLCSFNMSSVKIELWENPWAKYPITNELIELPRNVPIINNSGTVEKIIRRPGKKVNDILGIEEFIQSLDKSDDLF